MKIALTVGHSQLKNGSYTSADGRKYGGCNEYKWCKKFSKQAASALRKKGHRVTRIVCPQKTFTSGTQERGYKLNLINSGNYDLVMELHLNASDSAHARGTEVLYKSGAGKKYAENVQRQLSSIFYNRGVRQRADLYILNATKPPAILLETFFCTSKQDFSKARGFARRKKLARLVAKGIGRAV